MPQYHVVPGKSVFQQQPMTLLFGHPAIPGGPPELAKDQFEPINSGDKSVTVCSSGFTNRQVEWVTSFDVSPSAVSLMLQGAMEDDDAQYITVDTSTGTTGERRTIASSLRFFRILVGSLTGAAKVMVKAALM